MKKPALSKRVTCHTESVSCLPTDMDALLDHLHKVKKDAKKAGYINLSVEFETEWGYYDDSWVEMKVYGNKPISVKEFVEGKQQYIKAN